MSNYTETVERNLEGLEYVSPGACPGCAECEEIRTEGMTDEEFYDLAGERSFSWSECETCRSSFGGDRYPAHGVSTTDGALVHFEVCTDCVMYLANGDEPEEPWFRTPAERRAYEHDQFYLPADKRDPRVRLTP